MSTTREQLDQLARKAYGPSATIKIENFTDRGRERRCDIRVEFGPVLADGNRNFDELSYDLVSAETGFAESAAKCRIRIQEQETEQLLDAVAIAAKELYGMSARIDLEAMRVDAWIATVAGLHEAPGATARDALIALLSALDEEREERDAAVRSALSRAREIARAA